VRQQRTQSNNSEFSGGVEGSLCFVICLINLCGLISNEMMMMIMMMIRDSYFAAVASASINSTEKFFTGEETSVTPLVAAATGPRPRKMAKFITPLFNAIP